MAEPWWTTGVVYQIYPRSFCDTTGSGMGDLEGIRSKLDYLQWLGVDAIWLSPINPSPMADMGYDVADYCDVDPMFGDLATMDALIADAHARDIRVLLDWVPNHTSDQHPWFVESRSSRDNAKADWYWWRDATPGISGIWEPPNNWEANFVGGPAWTFDETRGQVYLHNFLPEQPDLNWRNPEVVAAMHDTLRFWLDRGVDGFRIDVIHLLGKPEALPDQPDDLVARVNFFDFADTHPILRDIRTLLDSYDNDRMAVGEVFLLSTALVAKYYGDNNDELHLAFNFPPLFARWDADVWRRRIDRTLDELGQRDAWPTWVLSNHDNPRHRTRYGGGAGPARAAAVLLLTQRGTPFLYAGEELGLEDAVIAPQDMVDPGGRDGCRAPIPWDRVDGNDFVDLYRALLKERRTSPALQAGSFAWLESEPGVLAYERVLGDDRREVMIDFVNGRAEVRRGEEVRVAT